MFVSINLQLFVLLVLTIVVVCIYAWRKSARVTRVPSIPKGAKGVFILYYTDEVFDCVGVESQLDFRTAIPEEVMERTVAIFYVTKNDVVMYRTHGHTFREPVVLCQ